MMSRSISRWLLLASVSLLFLGLESGIDDPWQGSEQRAFLEGPIVQKYQCVTCHTITDQGGTVGPVLNLVGLRRSEEWLSTWLSDPNQVKPGTKMPKFPFEAGELDVVIESLTHMKRTLETDAILARDASPEETGEALFADYDCRACHRIGDTGRFVGPDLTWVGARKPQSWEEIWLRDPDAFKPGTFMPDFKIPPDGVEALAAYLHTLAGQHNDKSREAEFRVNLMINNNDVRRGEMVASRLACWSCHGEKNQGGVKNPNTTSDHAEIPGLEGVRDAYSLAEFLARVNQGGPTLPALEPDNRPLPFSCPPYQGALNRLEGEDLYAYISSLGPEKVRWKFN